MLRLTYLQTGAFTGDSMAIFIGSLIPPAVLAALIAWVGSNFILKKKPEKGFHKIFGVAFLLVSLIALFGSFS